MKKPGTVRNLIAEATRKTHDALDRHEDVGMFMRDTLDVFTYRMLLEAYARFYEAAETQRQALGAWPELALQPTVDALNNDVERLNGGSFLTREHQVDMSWVASPIDCLSMLYVLHGAGFGGKVIARKVAVTLPDAPRSYLSFGIDSTLWKTLVERLEAYAGDQEACTQLIDAAEQTFSAFGTWISLYCSAARTLENHAVL